MSIWFDGSTTGGNPTCRIWFDAVDAHGTLDARTRIAYESVKQARERFDAFIAMYNSIRSHAPLDEQTADTVYTGTADGPDAVWTSDRRVS